MERGASDLRVDLLLRCRRRLVMASERLSVDGREKVLGLLAAGVGWPTTAKSRPTLWVPAAGSIHEWLWAVERS